MKETILKSGGRQSCSFADQYVKTGLLTEVHKGAEKSNLGKKHFDFIVSIFIIPIHLHT